MGPRGHGNNWVLETALNVLSESLSAIVAKGMRDIFYKAPGLRDILRTKKAGR